MHPSLPRLRGKLEVDTELGTFLGDTRIRLLEAIAKHGSISQAAKAVPLSYKAAWDAQKRAQLGVHFQLAAQAW
jgi:molybdate transport system regulatory protein